MTTLERPDQIRLPLAGTGQTILMMNGDRIAAHVEKTGYFERRTVEWVTDYLRKSQPTTLLDIGAYTGLYSVIGAKLGASVVAFEPMPQQASRILTNMAINGLACRIIQSAASDQTGMATIHYNPAVHLTSGASLEKLPSSQRMTVRTIRVDEALAMDNKQDDFHVGLVKIDVEGHEVRVLDGMRRTLEHHKPWIVAEANDEEHQVAILGHLSGRYELEAVMDNRNLILGPV